MNQTLQEWLTQWMTEAGYSPDDGYDVATIKGMWQKLKTWTDAL